MRRAASFYAGFAAENHISINYQLASLAIAFLVGAMPSAASARPNSAASFYVIFARPWYAHGGNGRWAGESLRCEDPAPTVGIAGRGMRRMRHRPSFAPAWASTGTANGGITTRHAASLRPSSNGRIGFKPPYSKKRPRQKTSAWGQSFLGEDFPFLRVNRFQSRNSISRRP